jgi:hypothetical protein
MPKISTYPVVTPASNDLVTVTDASDSNATKNVTVQGLLAASGQKSYTEIYDLGGSVTDIISPGVYYPLVCVTTTGLTNDNTITQNGAGVITNTGQPRTFIVTFHVGAETGGNTSLSFFLRKNQTTISYSETDLHSQSQGRGSTSNSVIVSLNTNDTISFLAANNTSTTDITLRHLNIIILEL